MNVGEAAQRRRMPPPPSPSLVWFLLVGADGESYKGTTSSSVSLPPTAVVDQFRKAVKAESPNLLSAVDTAQLKVYRNKAAFDGKEEPLEEDSTIAGLGGSKRNALIVLVPEQPARREAAQPLTREELDNALEKLEHKKEKTATYAITSINTEHWQKICNKTGMHVTYLPCTEPATTTPSIPAYDWMENVAEDNVLQRKAYMDYLQQHLGPHLPDGFSILDVAAKKKLLSLKDPRLPFHLTGGTDILVVDSISIEFENPLAGVRIVGELKKKAVPQSMNQAFTKMLSADIVSPAETAVVGMLTDLRYDWRFMWLEKGKIVVVKFKQPKTAFDFIHQVLTKDWREELTLSIIGRPMKRCKFNDFMPPVVDDHLEEELERYELMADELEPEFLYHKRREYAEAVVRSNPMLSIWQDERLQDFP